MLISRIHFPLVTYAPVISADKVNKYNFDDSITMVCFVALYVYAGVWSNFV